MKVQLSLLLIPSSLISPAVGFQDLQVQLVDPEEIPAMERLTQEVLVLREKVAIAESQGQEATGNRRQQVVCQWGRLGCVCISAGARL